MNYKGLKAHEADYEIIRRVAFERKIKMVDLLHEMVSNLPVVKNEIH